MDGVRHALQNGFGSAALGQYACPFAKKPRHPAQQKSCGTDQSRPALFLAVFC